ncbi:carbonic anhydrase [Colletotrichum scovillei]|uniref:carbonic anhydrase n=1 Tax=Colletotrichum scovillei TaxID=1209932 RepID=UPI0015C2C6A0|nr:carbonic anhydrase [Colletotrichum scovillei]KAF4782812.1 carbonic anhydrase [Colletotrichum scovillei]
MFKASPFPRSLPFRLFSSPAQPSRRLLRFTNTIFGSQHQHLNSHRTSSFSHIAYQRAPPSSSSSSSTPPSIRPDRKMAESDIEKYLKQTHDRVFENNRKWAEEKKKQDPNFFISLSQGQQITGLEPGEAFIHRNIANMVNNIDLNVMSVINYAAAMTPKDLGLLNPWLRNIRDVYRLHEAELDAIKEEDARYDRLVELNVLEQCRNVIKTAAIQQSYAKNKFPIVHGWVFGFNDGLLKDLEIDHEKMLHDVQKLYHLPGADF